MGTLGTYVNIGVGVTLEISRTLGNSLSLLGISGAPSRRRLILGFLTLKILLLLILQLMERNMFQVNTF